MPVLICRTLAALCCIAGSLLGTSPLTIFAESAVGIRAGGRTGITAGVVAFGECAERRIFFQPMATLSWVMWKAEEVLSSNSRLAEQPRRFARLRA